MRMAARAFLILAAIAAAPFAAKAQPIEITRDTYELSEGRSLARGTTWTTSYVLAPDVPGFYLDLTLFSGNAATRGVLSEVRFGIGAADRPYDSIVSIGSGGGRYGYGIIENVYIDSPFSIVYNYLATPGAVTGYRAQVNYTGYITHLPVTSVPEIGAKGALAAMMLVLGSIAVMTGTRRRDELTPQI